jgi:glycogen debranching enzyme
VRRVRVEPGWAAFDLAAGELRISRERFVDGGLHERITITNPGPPAEAEVEIVAGADFADMMSVRGAVSNLPPRSASVTETWRGILLQDGLGEARATEVVVEPGGTRQRARLGTGESLVLNVDVLQKGSGRIRFEPGLARIRAAYASWAEDCASFETDNPALNELLRQSRDDLRLLNDTYATGMYPSAGLPWFAVPFGRDALITASQMLAVNPAMARGVLRYLAAHQGRRVNPRTEEEPGKILHEVRSGESVARGLWPPILYGTVDATPLYLCVLTETLDWTGDGALFEELRPAADAALAWCESYGDADGDGYIEYSAGMARNQGWKDSGDSLTHTNGSPAPLPAALCEVQGYLYRGLVGMARSRPDLKARAAELRERFGRDFWIAHEQFVAQALDGAKRPVEAISSNPGHCLRAGILLPEQARQVATRLVSPDMFSGWGVRTLSTGAINYDPCSYHNGSVWPFDSAMAAAGLRETGFAHEAELIARAVLEAGMTYPDRRLPELYCGNEREPGAPPVDYRASAQHGYQMSCSPQAWAAGASFQLVTTLLGLQADAAGAHLRIAPVETPLWRRLEVNGLHFAGERIDFAVDGTRVRIGHVPSGMRVEAPPA